MPSSSSSVSRRRVCRRAGLVLSLVIGAGCSARQTETATPDGGADASTNVGGSATTANAATPTERTETETTTRTSLVLHDVDRDDLPHRSQVAVVSPEMWEWVTRATETGAADVGTETGWTPTFSETDTTPTSTPAGPASPRVDLAVAAADVLVVDGNPYAVRTVYASESYAAIEGVSVEAIPASDDDRSLEEIRVATVSELPPEQRRIARAAIESDQGYEVGYHERRTEAFEAVRAYDYFRYRNRSYRRYLAQGDSFDVHTTLWAEPIEAVGADDVVFEVAHIDLSARGHHVLAAAVADGAGAETVETVPAALVDAVETYDYLATTTGLYRPRLVR